MIVAPNVTNVVGVFTMGFGIMTSVITNNVSALAALANGLLPLRKVARSRSPRRHDRERTPAAPSHRDLLPLPNVAAVRRARETSSAFLALVTPVGDRVPDGRARFPLPRASETPAGSATRSVVGIIPSALRPLLPQPDDPVHVLRLTAEILEPGHALTAMVLRVHRRLHHRLGDRDDAGRIRKPGDPDRPRQRLGVQARREVAESCVRNLGPLLQLFEGIGRPARRTPGASPRKIDRNPCWTPMMWPTRLAHLLMVAGRRLVPGMEEDGVGPLRVVHELAQEGLHSSAPCIVNPLH